MKTSRAFVIVGLVLVLTVVSVAYSSHATARVRELEQRLQQAEALLKSQAQSLADSAPVSRVSSLEQRLQAAELAALQSQAFGHSTVGLEQRIQSVEETIKPRMETPSPHDPYYK